MTHAERRALIRTIGAGSSLLLIGFLPWLGQNSAWTSWLNLWGTQLPSWMVVVCGVALAVLAYLELRAHAAFSWKLYLAISVYALLQTAIFLFFVMAESSFQIGPPLALAAFVVTGLTAYSRRSAKPRRRTGTKRKRGPRRKSGPSR